MGKVRSYLLGKWERLGLVSWGSGKVGKVEWFKEKKKGFEGEVGHSGERGILKKSEKKKEKKN